MSNMALVEIGIDRIAEEFVVFVETDGRRTQSMSFKTLAEAQIVFDLMMSIAGASGATPLAQSTGTLQ